MTKSKTMELIEDTIAGGDPVRSVTAFPVEDVSFRVLTSSDRGARIAAYVDARDVMERLDDLFVGWSDSYEMLADHREPDLHQVTMQCQIDLPGYTTSVSDVGTAQSTGKKLPDEFIYKAAASDAFKRAAVHLGIGRELYNFKRIMGRDLWLTPEYLNGQFISKGGLKKVRAEWAEYLTRLAQHQNDKSPYENVTIEEMRALSVALALKPDQKTTAHKLGLEGMSLEQIREALTT